MTSDDLARDYLRRARSRRKALQTLFDDEAYADVVRESQEVVELILKGTLRFIAVDPPMRHDVWAAVREFADRLPGEWREALDDLGAASAGLARVRGQAFYGDEQTLTPASELFDRDDALEALSVVDRFLAMYERLLGEGRQRA